jgi:hypothetical protein
MNVLFVIHTPKNPKTAVYTCFRTRADFIDSQGHTTHITAPEDYRFLKSLSSRWYPLIFPVFLAFELLFKRISYDLIVFHSYSGWLINAMRRRVDDYRISRSGTP